jgi:hypothetical protein
VRERGGEGKKKKIVTKTTEQVVKPSFSFFETQNLRDLLKNLD